MERRKCQIWELAASQRERYIPTSAFYARTEAKAVVIVSNQHPNQLPNTIREFIIDIFSRLRDKQYQQSTSSDLMAPR